MPSLRANQAGGLALSIETEVRMSSPQLRRADRVMSEQRACEMLARGFSGQLATVGEDGYPYCIPLLYLWMDGEVYVHTSSARGHFRTNVEREPRFCEALMAKYGKPDTTRPKGFFPRIDVITVYAISVERMTGKEMALPDLSEQWPAKDRTKTPNARPGSD